MPDLVDCKVSRVPSNADLIQHKPQIVPEPRFITGYQFSRLDRISTFLNQLDGLLKVPINGLKVHTVVGA